MSLTKYVVMREAKQETWALVGGADDIEAAVHAREHAISREGGRICIFEAIDTIEAYAQAARLRCMKPGALVPVTPKEETKVETPQEEPFELTEEEKKLLDRGAHVVAPASRTGGGNEVAYEAEEVTGQKDRF